MVSTLSVLILLFALFSAFHFVYEGIVLPTLRTRLRFKLFALRDNLRRAKIQLGSQVEDSVFLYLERSINSSIRFLEHLDLETMYAARRFIESNPALLEDVKRRMKTLDECPVEEIRAIRSEHRTIVQEALAANGLALLAYIVPIVVAVVFLQRIKHTLDEVILLPEPTMAQVAPRRRLKPVGAP